MSENFSKKKPRTNSPRLNKNGVYEKQNKTKCFSKHILYMLEIFLVKTESFASRPKLFYPNLNST